MIRERTVVKEAQEIEDVLCDLCGASTQSAPEKESQFGFEYATLRFCGGYYSNHDGLSFELQFCEKCALDIFKRRVRPQDEPEIPEEGNYSWGRYAR